jgi:hypothetical protein
VEVSAVTTPAEHGQESTEDEVSTEELVRRHGAGVITSVEQLDSMAHPELWDTEEDYQQFLADLYASRRANIA